MEMVERRSLRSETEGGPGSWSQEAGEEGEAGVGYDEGGTVRRNAAAHLNQIGAEIQLTAAVR